MITSFKLTTLRAAFVGLAACAATVGTLPASAGPAYGTVPTVHVRYDDLDLQSDAGTLSLYRRISQAARSVCPDADSRDLLARSRSNQCQADAIARAVTDVNSPRLAQLVAAHSSRG